MEVFLAIGATGFARVDMLLSADGIPYISEINTMPGLHAHQPLPAHDGARAATTSRAPVSASWSWPSSAPPPVPITELRPDELP